MHPACKLAGLVVIRIQTTSGERASQSSSSPSDGNTELNQSPLRCPIGWNSNTGFSHRTQACRTSLSLTIIGSSVKDPGKLALGSGSEKSCTYSEALVPELPHFVNPESPPGSRSD
mmetsp:Transcript_45652/g.89873  ORF Transcript_45652/g.89873 Transcript_45652/m.89873 type:complete len:116 (-) Transcript_45652:721-1068(-)